VRRYCKDFGVEVTCTFETAEEFYATETQGGEDAVAVHRGAYDRMGEAHDATGKMDGGEQEGPSQTSGMEGAQTQQFGFCRGPTLAQHSPGSGQTRHMGFC
jgi:hypothetical protein